MCPSRQKCTNDVKPFSDLFGPMLDGALFTHGVSVCVLHLVVSSRNLCSVVCSAALLIESLQLCE